MKGCVRYGVALTLLPQACLSDHATPSKEGLPAMSCRALDIINIAANIVG